MQLPPSTLTARLSTSALQLIDCPFDHRSIGEERFDNPLDLASQLGKRLPKLTEFFSIPLILYAHRYITYRFRNKSQGKNEPPQNFFLGELEDYLVVVRTAAYGWLTRGYPIPSPWDSLLSELQYIVDNSDIG